MLDSVALVEPALKFQENLKEYTFHQTFFINLGDNGNDTTEKITFNIQFALLLWMYVMSTFKSEGKTELNK